MIDPSENPLKPHFFDRVDESSDENFYAEARLVTHIDDRAIQAARLFYGMSFPGGHLLDLCSSWVSHLPTETPYASVTGLGMNQAELDANPQLTRRVVQDLNVNPVLPFSDGEFDGAVCTVSVQYLTKPVEVFAEVGRCLKPGASFVLTYSNRCFPTKAVWVWRALGDREHADLIGLYLRLSGQFGDSKAFDLSPDPGNSDPLFAVVANRREDAIDAG